MGGCPPIQLFTVYSTRTHSHSLDMGGGHSLCTTHSAPYHIKKIVRTHVAEKVRESKIRGNFGWVFIGKDNNFLYKVHFYGNKDLVQNLYEKLSTTRQRVPSEYLCHSLTTQLVEENYIISKYNRHRGDLHELSRTLTFTDKNRILLQLVAAVTELHSMGACHGDIKPENILLTDRNKVLLCDLDGVGRPTELRTIGTEFYAPPIGLVREGVHMCQDGVATWYEFYAMLDLFGVGVTIEAILRDNMTKNIHVRAFWNTLTELFTETNVRCFFSDNKKDLNIRAVDSVAVAVYYNMALFDTPVCDCVYRRGMPEGCVYCDNGEVEEVRVVETTADLGLA